MGIAPDLVALLACPVCRAAVNATPEGDLACEGCGRIYPVEDGIPQMLPESARPGPSGSTEP